MKVSWGNTLLRALVLLALGTSIALLLDYMSPDPAFCGGTSGCAQVRASGFGHLPIGPNFAVPVPIFGVAGFTLLFLLSLLLNRPRVLTILRIVTGVGAAAAVGFIIMQGLIGHFCLLCLIVDGAMLLIFALTYVTRFPPNGLKAESLVSFSAWLGLLGLAILAPLLYPRLVRKSPVPPVILQMYEPGEITVLEFFDFQCPHCRHLSPRLKRVVSEFPQAKIKYGYTPLPGHEPAHIAARMSICAAEQGKEMELTHRFFTQEDLSDEALVKTALEVLPDQAAFGACLASSRPDERIQHDIAAIREAGFVGLPATYIGGIRILGADEDRVYRDALSKVESGRDRSGMPGWLYWMTVAAAALLVGIWGRSRPPNASGATGPA